MISRWHFFPGELPPDDGTSAGPLGWLGRLTFSLIRQAGVDAANAYEFPAASVIGSDPATPWLKYAEVLLPSLPPESGETKLYYYPSNLTVSAASPVRWACFTRAFPVASGWQAVAGCVTAARPVTLEFVEAAGAGGDGLFATDVGVFSGWPASWTQLSTATVTLNEGEQFKPTMTAPATGERRWFVRKAA